LRVIKVTIRHGEPPEKFVQRFKRICSKEGVFKEIKSRRYYEKPSDKKRRKAKEAVRALRKRARQAQKKR
jgi:small subunit ribosomal protein S21